MQGRGHAVFPGKVTARPQPLLPHDEAPGGGFGDGDRVHIDWLDTILSDYKDNKDSSNWLLPDRLGQLLAEYTSKETQKLIVDEFNMTTSPYRKFIKDWFLANISNLSLNSFTEESLSYLISDLNNKQDHGVINIGDIATEEFVEQRLVPLMEIEDEPFKSNLLKTIRDAAERNNRRFVSQ
jgi:hypothetical protein